MQELCSDCNSNRHNISDMQGLVWGEPEQFAHSLASMAASVSASLLGLSLTLCFLSRFALCAALPNVQQALLCPFLLFLLSKEFK